MLFLKNIKGIESIKNIRNVQYPQLIKPAALIIVAVIATFSFFTKASAPTIVSILPASGSQAGGDIVTITGTHFKEAPSVMFGGTPAPNVTLESETVITATVPAHNPGKVNVTVINTDGQYAIVIDAYTYNYPPTITSVSPNIGSTQGGDIVMIKGAHFFGTPTIQFGDTLASNVIVNSSDTLSVTTPTHSAGMVDITLANPDGQATTLVAAFTFSDTPVTTTDGATPVDLSGGTSTDSTTTTTTPTTTTTTTTSPTTTTTQKVTKTYHTTENTYSTMSNPAPTITSISPSNGNRFGGDSITITGTNFVATPVVTFGGINAISTIYQSSTTIVVTTPANNTGGSVNVVVTNPDAQSVTAVNGFTYLTGAPTISSITPNTGSTAGGDYITILGTNFYGSPTVTIGGSSATNIIVRSATKITAYTPAHAAGTVDVVLTNQDTQSVTLTSGFTYASFGNPAPTISSVSPSHGTAGTAITITGINFLTGPTVKINGVNATNVTFVSATSITANAPTNSTGTYDVTVTNTDGQTTTLTDGFTYDPTIIAPTVSTSDAAEITPDSATLGATITAAGGENPTRYIEWGTASGTYTDSCNQGTGSGSYSCNLTNLSADTTYYFRAKATNSAGASYGQEKSFTTIPSSVTITDPDSTKLNSANTSGYIKSSGSFSGTSKSTFNTTVIFKRNANQISIPRNAQITKTSGGNFDMSQFTITDVSTQIKQAVPTSLAAVEIGIANTSLTFSTPGTLSIAVGSVYNGKTLAVQSQSTGQNDWTNEGTCTVTNGQCSFPVTHATTYTVNGEPSGSTGSTDMAAYLKLDRLTANATTGGTICMTPNIESTEASMTITFPTGFTVNQTASNWTTTTDNLPSGATAWVGIGTATIVSGQSVTFPSSDLVVGQLSCFNFSATNTLTNSTSGTSKIGSITTKDASAAVINSSEYAVAIISSDLVLLTATVPPILTVQLQSGGDTFITPLSTTAVTKTNGKTLAIATNADNGWVAWVRSANTGLASSSSSAMIATIGSIDNTPTDLSANPTGYLLGVDITSDSTIGYGTVSQQSNYGAEYKSEGNLNLGGTLSTTFQPVAACDGTTGGDILTLTEKAKITSVQSAALDYTDTLTIVVGGRF